MCPAITRIGDADIFHCEVPNRRQGSPNVTCNGIAISRQGDLNTVHKTPPNVPPCPSHAAGITTGSTTVTINGKGCGRVGDRITGCTEVAEGSQNVTCGG